MPRNTIKVAIMYDFDKTLSPKDMQEYDFIPDVGIKAAAFWKESYDLAKNNNMDKILAYMYLMIKKAGENNIPITRESFVDKGKHVELFKGVKTWFDRITEYGKKKGIIVEHYIISSGLKEIVEGTPIADKFTKIYASEFYYDVNKVAKWPAMAVNYTSKTQFLFRINKGVLDVTDDFEINRYIKKEERVVPFTNMIYIGDGFTDVPCMKLVKVNGGHSIAVYQPGSAIKKETAEKLIQENRVNFIASADYSAGKPIEKIVFGIIDKIYADSIVNKMKSQVS
jgi:2-hydroxy-3-keto-5-methylthiopentenyl-1-phosphate phosphatase